MSASLQRQPRVQASRDADATDAATTEPSTQPWYVAYTRPRQEAIALVNLQAQGFNAYLPLYKTNKKQELAHEPMFPRYIFLQPCSARQSLSTVRSTRGISTLIRFGTDMATLRPCMLDAIRQLEQRRNDMPAEELAALRPGRRVRLCDTPLAGLEGLVHAVSSKRVTLLLEILGHQRELKIHPSKLQAVD